MYLTRINGRKSVALKDMIGDPIIVELRSGKVYGGGLEGLFYYAKRGFVKLYFCKVLNELSHRWVDHDRMIKYGNEISRDPMPRFWIANMKDIFVLPEEYRDEFSLDDALQIYIDPHYKPFTGIQCNWEPRENRESPEKKHSLECDIYLHEGLSFLVAEARLSLLSGPRNRQEYRKRRLKEALAYVRRRLLMYGAKIP